MQYEKECAACGESFVCTNQVSKYCDKCKKLSDTRRKKIREEREAREAAEYQALMLRRRKENPFDLSWKTLARVDAEAKLFGMTYGTYTAACRCGFIIPILKNKGFIDPVKMLEQLEDNLNGDG